MTPQIHKTLTHYRISTLCWDFFVDENKRKISKNKEIHYFLDLVPYQPQIFRQSKNGKGKESLDTPSTMNGFVFLFLF